MARWICLGLAVLSFAPVQGASPYRKLLPLSAWIVNSKGQSSGSGFVIRRSVGRQGWYFLLTNYHVVARKNSPYYPGPRVREVTVYHPMYRGGELVTERSIYENSGTGKIGYAVWADPKKDLALVYVNEQFPAAHWPFATETFPLGAVEPGDEIYGLGNPGVSEAMWNMSVGNVRQIQRRRFTYPDRHEIDSSILESSLPINAGDSGGPIVDRDGLLVGVTTSHLEGVSQLSMGTSFHDLRAFMEQAEKRNWYLPSNGKGPNQIDPSEYAAIYREQMAADDMYWATYFADFWLKRVRELGRDSSEAETALQEARFLQKRHSQEAGFKIINNCFGDLTVHLQLEKYNHDFSESRWYPEGQWKKVRVPASSETFVRSDDPRLGFELWTGSRYRYEASTTLGHKWSKSGDLVVKKPVLLFSHIPFQIFAFCDAPKR